MGQLSMDLYLKQLRDRYAKASKKAKSQILEEFCQTSGFHRKHAIRLLNQQVRKSSTNKAGRKSEYDSENLLLPLKRIWLATNQMCGKRLKEALPHWLPHYEASYGPLAPGINEQLLAISSASIDRLLSPLRTRYKRSYGGTKPGSILKTHIPIKTDQWNTHEPGFVEADTVAHCGGSMSGDFVWSLTLTDIFSGWTELRAVWNKGSIGVLEQISDIEASLAFKLKGFDCDNGSEFLNWHLMRYFADHPSGQSIQFTRSRPYHSDDNAHVEQKNWTHVRQLLGYYRIDNKSIIPLINDLYKNEISQLNNYFIPSVKLLEKTRIHSKISKKHDKARTPFERLMNSDSLADEEKLKLKQTYETLNPFEIKERIEKKLNQIFSMINVKVGTKRTAI